MTLSVVTKPASVLVFLLLGIFSSSGNAVIKCPPAAPKCPHPFFFFHGECFYLNVHEKKSWEDARVACKALGGDLAEPQNFHSFLRMKKEIVGDAYVWLGISDAVHEGQWVGVSGKFYSTNTLPWAAGEPNNLHGGTEDYLHTFVNNLLNDKQGCSDELYGCGKFEIKDPDF